MGTIAENKTLWTDYDWQEQGDEWSAEWGTTEILWWGTIRPRINAFVPTGTIREIAPGVGRCTQYLKDLCQRLMVGRSHRQMDRRLQAAVFRRPPHYIPRQRWEVVRNDPGPLGRFCFQL